VLDSAHGAAIRRAVEEKAAILAIVAKLSKADRALMPELAPTVNSLVERIVDLARTLHRLDQSIDPRQAGELDARIAELEPESATPEGERRLGLLRRQRASVEDLIQRRAALARQLDSAGLALGNLRYDLIKIGSSGIASVITDVTSATQQARALSREIDTVLEAVAEVKGL
jgi:hypothetical protein